MIDVVYRIGRKYKSECKIRDISVMEQTSQVTYTFYVDVEILSFVGLLVRRL